jgi:hypothetical protein
MTTREPDALWEEALREEEAHDRLTEAIAAEAVRLYGRDPDALRVMAKTRYLGEKKMTSYVVSWEIDAEADSPREAAEFARRQQTAPDTWAVVFNVTDIATGETVRVDLLDDEDEEQCDG